MVGGGSPPTWGSPWGMLSDIVALSSTDAWAVGRYWYQVPLEEKETPEVSR